MTLVASPTPTLQSGHSGRVRKRWTLGALLMLVVASCNSTSRQAIDDSSLVRPEVASTAVTATTAPKAGRCTWRAEVLGRDGGGGHNVMILGFTNIGGESCLVPNVQAVFGTGVDGRRVGAGRGTYFPIGPAQSRVDPRDRVEQIIETTSWCAGDPPPRPVRSLVIELRDHSPIGVTLNGPLNTACGLGFSELGTWE